MQDQSIPVGDGFVLDRDARVMVPAMMVNWLREAAYAEIAQAAEARDMVALDVDREAHPEWFRGPAQSLKHLRVAGRDRVGQVRSPDPVRLDLREDYCWALMRALQQADEFAEDDDDEGDAVRGDAEGTQLGSAVVYDREARRVGVLRDFIVDPRRGSTSWRCRKERGKGLVLSIAA